MSFTASRFQPRFGYGPALRVGNFPGQMPGALPSLPSQAMPAPAAPPAAPAPAAPAAPPIMAGSLPIGLGDGGRGGDISSDREGNVFGLGPNPGNLGALGAGLSGFGVGGLGGALGGLAGGMLAGPLGALAGLAFGGLAQPALSGTLLSSDVAQPAMSRDMMDAYAADLGVNIGNSAAPTGQDFMGQAAAALGVDIGGGSPAASSGDFMSEAAAALGVDIGGSDWGGADAGPGGGSGDMGGGSNPGAGEGGNWRDGGYTGPGHPASPAGTVHKGEVVIPAEMVARYGLRPLMALVEGTVPPSRLAALARG